MTDYLNSDHPDSGQPSVAEIAALTRRLRELSTPGRAVDPGEWAAFLAGKDALLARITDAHTATELRGQTVENDPARREQLARWHTDDTADTLDVDDVHQEPGGSRSATDDGPGLP
ncbi:hypothetical protein I4I73_13025 [Pseudonocardia sp. KRD-184]|uniref:Uncharacterized protein n=1 Tax=Pseudonocardia oceani TaxID=2792013 RepID=A0ABS6U8D1_9PSEU|nr:hypothetical protein [Pseudonocardia oceani]MBW0091516.1 hypothetical protein [Pseudonocardia oceani]MBW0096909.1 hypothetical protein [Pseudonocardia oceani]MBW0123724.1 hypothetical protein [Pseudonocardia oceani]MBW0128499.1 hypothetical protein [Pseudonocardia oceani]